MKIGVAAFRQRDGQSAFRSIVRGFHESVPYGPRNEILQSPLVFEIHAGDEALNRFDDDDGANDEVGLWRILLPVFQE